MTLLYSAHSCAHIISMIDTIELNTSFIKYAYIYSWYTTQNTTDTPTPDLFSFYNSIDCAYICDSHAATRETSFVQAMSAAGVVYTLTRNCSLGDIDKCGCDDSRQGQRGEPPTMPAQAQTPPNGDSTIHTLMLSACCMP